MIELHNDSLCFSFPEVHADAKCQISFQRTLRIPDDGREYPLPASLGRFPLTHIEDNSETVPEAWKSKGGVLLPMYQSEAMWLSFDSGFDDYPMAIMITAGKINAIDGNEWNNELNNNPQNYLYLPEQPWLDGYFAGKGSINIGTVKKLGNKNQVSKF